MEVVVNIRMPYTEGTEDENRKKVPNMSRVCIKITLGQLWSAYATKPTGRFPCPVTLKDGREATHIYSGFGKIRLEQVTEREINNGKKGFKGVCLAEVGHFDSWAPELWIQD